MTSRDLRVANGEVNGEDRERPSLLGVSNLGDKPDETLNLLEIELVSITESDSERLCC